MARRGQHDPPQVSWTFITTHGLVLLAIARDRTIRLRDVAEQAGITERAVQRIVRDLCEAGYLERRRVGRRNEYQLHTDLHLPHRTTRHQHLGALVGIIVSDDA